VPGSHFIVHDATADQSAVAPAGRAAALAAIRAIAMLGPMALKLRRIIWDDGKASIDREDYEIIDTRGKKIGRIYRTIAVGGGHLWRWSVYSIAIKDKWDSHQHCGPLRRLRGRAWRRLDEVVRSGSVRARDGLSRLGADARGAPAAAGADGG